jgi:hypothetical protein
MEDNLFILHFKKEMFYWITKIKQKDIPSLLLKTLVFLVILFLLDFVIGNILGNLYSKQKPGDIYRATYSLDSTKADILIFGSSRANHHYIPPIFKKRMNLSCYNTGRDGQSIFYNYAILKSVLKRYSPKMVIIDFSPGEFEIERQSYDRLSALTPYYKSHSEIRDIIKLRSPFEKYKLLSKIYPYNSLIFTVLMGAAKSHEKRKHVKEQNGYIPLTDSCYTQLVIDSAARTDDLDSNKINAFKSFIRDCKNANVKTFVVLSPLFIKYLHEDPSTYLAMEVAKKYNVPVFSFINDPFFYNDLLFAGDGTHLNDSGAKIFTNLVIDLIIKNQKAIPRQNLANKHDISNK